MSEETQLAEFIKDHGISNGEEFCLNIDHIEQRMLSMDQADCPVRHYFSKGIYIREVRLPAGIFAIGHEQKFAHMNVMISGKVRMLNDDGSTTDLIAPMTFVGKPGRKIGLIVEDVVWQNIYPTDETDIETLESTYLNKSVAFLSHQEIEKSKNLQLSYADNSDYEQMLIDVGITHEIAVSESENESDQIEMPDGWNLCSVFSSPIHGKGYFATANISAGELIAPALIGGKRTPAGRYVNHSKKPNAKMIALPDGDIALVSIKDIRGCRAGQLGDEVTVDYRQALLAANKITFTGKD